MVAMERGQDLHDRATQGLPLTEEERVDLDRWRAEMDSQEDAMLRAHASASEEELRGRIEAALARLHRVRARAQELDTGNRKLEAEIEGLKRQLADRQTPAAR